MCGLSALRLARHRMPPKPKPFKPEIHYLGLKPSDSDDDHTYGPSCDDDSDDEDETIPAEERTHPDPVFITCFRLPILDETWSHDASVVIRVPLNARFEPVHEALVAGLHEVANRLETWLRVEHHYRQQYC